MVNPEPVLPSHSSTRLFNGLLVLLLTAGVGWMIFFWVSPLSVIVMPFDDSWYYVKTAQNFNDGYGISFDRLTETDGFHPLWFITLVGLDKLFRVDNPTRWMRIILTIQLGFVFWGWWFVSHVVRKIGSKIRWFVLGILLLFLLNPVSVKILVNGLESALLFLFLACSHFLYAKAEQTGRVRDYFIVGLCSGAAFLARMDAIIFIWGLGIGLLWDIVQQKDKAWKKAFATGIGTLILAAPYLVWHYLHYKHFMTVSGTIKIGSTSNTHALLLVIIALATVTVLLALRSRSEFVSHFYPLMAYAILILPCYLLAYSFLPRPWYIGPWIMLGVITLAWACSIVPPDLPWSVFGFRLAKGVVLVTLLLFDGVAWMYRLEPESYSLYKQAQSAGLWVKAHLPQDQPMAAWDAGVSSAFSERGVTNLDGLIASWEFKEDFLDQHRIQAFLERENISIIIQYFMVDIMIHQINKPVSKIVHRGVDFTNWHVLYASPFSFRTLQKPLIVTNRVFFVLARPGVEARFDDEPTLLEWMSEHYLAPGVDAGEGKNDVS